MQQSANLAHSLGFRLTEVGMTICAAESCTGGLFLSTLTDVPGSSNYVAGGVVTYSNQAKQQLVAVREKTLAEYGAVSAETAREMVIGVCDLFDADVGVSITGIAGPGGGTPEKPVGLVFIGAKVNHAVRVQQYNWTGDRVANKQQSVVAAMQLVLDLLASA